MSYTTENTNTFKPTKLLSILIATTIDRKHLFEPLLKEFQRQCTDVRDKADIEIIWAEDNKEISIGKKRQSLLEKSKGKYILFFDSDDKPHSYYIKEMVRSLKMNPDCVGFKIAMTTNGQKPQTCCHSLRYKEWEDNVDGYDYVRNVTHFNAVLREIAIKVGFEDKRYGEDIIYSNKITALCKKEIFIDRVMFDYNYSSEIPHNEKYGIK